MTISPSYLDPQYLRLHDRVSFGRIAQLQGSSCLLLRKCTVHPNHLTLPLSLARRYSCVRSFITIKSLLIAGACRLLSPGLRATLARFLAHLCDCIRFSSTNKNKYIYCPLQRTSTQRTYATLTNHTLPRILPYGNTAPSCLASKPPSSCLIFVPPCCTF